MTIADVSRIDRRVRREVERRGLYLVPLASEPGMPDHYVFVCTDPDPNDCGFTRVGQVSTTNGRLHVVYVMDGERRRPAVSLTQLRGHFPTWEDGIVAVLDAYDRWQ